jgi:hypothetical protein
VGGFFVQRFDNALWIIEKTYKWSVPAKESSPQRELISEPPTSRPLPWILFLPAAIVLRVVRMSMSFFSIIFGRGAITAADAVSYFQSRRRTLRALKFYGQKLKRIRQIEAEINDVDHQKELIGTLSEKRVEKVKTPKRRAKEIEESENEENIYESEEDEGLNCNDLLDKYASASGESSFELDPEKTVLSTSSLSANEDDDIELEMEKAVLALEQSVELISSEKVSEEDVVEVVAIDGQPKGSEAEDGGWQLQVNNKRKGKQKRKDLNKNNASWNGGSHYGQFVLILLKGLF